MTVMRLLLIFAAAAPLFAQNLCPYGIAPSQLLNIPAIYPGNSITVFADSDCTWTYSTDSPSWITFTSGPAKGIGSGDDTFSWSAAANVSPTVRQAKISVTGATGHVLAFTVSQAGAVCAITLPQPSASIGVSGGSGTFPVQANCTWSASVDVSWITLLSGKSGAGNVAGAVSPGEIVTLYGANIGPASPASFQVKADGTYAKSLGGTQVLFDGVPVGLTYASAVQVNAVAPYGLAPGATTCPQTECGGRLPV